MEKKQWWKNSTVYQIYPRSFQDTKGTGVGDLKGITRRLDYLKELGIDVIWLCPINASPNVDNGYDISDYEAIMGEFGTMEDFNELLGEAHHRELKIIMDLVVNHSSDMHPWFIESRSSRDNPKRDWYYWRDGFNGGPPNKLQSRFLGSAWQYDERTDQYYLHLFAPEQPDLNWDNPDLREAVYKMMRFWLDKGIDGFRLDVVNRFSKPAAALKSNGSAGHNCANGPLMHMYLKEMNQKVLSKYDVMTVGEAAQVSVEEAVIYAGEDEAELNMVFQFEHVHVDYVPVTGKWNNSRYKLSELKSILSRWQTGLYRRAWGSLYWCNHDQPRAVSRWGDDSSKLSREKSAKMIALCIYMMQGTPFIYQGEELGMTNMPFKDMHDIKDIQSINAYRQWVEERKVFSHDEMMAALRKMSRDNARTPMQWDDSPNAGFTTGTPWMTVNPNYREINAATQVNDPDSVFGFYKKLISLRKKHPIIDSGDYDLLLPEDERVFIYRRSHEDKTLLVLCNFSGGEVSDIDLARLGSGKGELLIANYPLDEINPLKLLPYEGRAYLKEQF